MPSNLRARPFPLPVRASGRHRLTPFAGHSIQFGSERRMPKINLMIKSIEFSRQSGKLEVAQRFQFIVSSGAPKSAGRGWAGRGENGKRIISQRGVYTESQISCGARLDCRCSFRVLIVVTCPILFVPFFSYSLSSPRPCSSSRTFAVRSLAPRAQSFRRSRPPSAAARFLIAFVQIAAS